jgi:hypothetical protein
LFLIRKEEGLGMVPVIPAPTRLRQEDLEFEASLDYMGKPYVKKDPCGARWYCIKRRGSNLDLVFNFC